VDLFQTLDLYCERTDTSFWAEPVNALTNLAFLVAAGLGLRAWQRAGGRDPIALGLIGLVAVIGVGSFLFHTFATHWALLADVIPIQLFMLAMFATVVRRLLGWPWWGVALASLGFIAAGLAAPRLMALVATGPGIGALAGYGTGLVAMLVLGLAGLRHPTGTARQLFAAAGVFAVSLTARTLDLPACATLPLGTHFLWHLFNAVTLALLLDVAVRLGVEQTDPRHPV
jgi:hypothetical protein